MRGMLTLEQELRATRLASGQKNTKQSTQLSDPKETERPWQHDIDQLHQTMREVMRAVATLSGVELPGLPPGLQDNAAPLPRLDIKTLKDRFRNDLEGFSLKTTEELAKRARERTCAAIEAVQNEISGRIDQIAAELREQLQLPAQIQKLLGPSVQEAAAGLEKSLGQKIERRFSEQDRIIQDKLQAALGSVQAQISALEQTVQQIRAKSDSIAQLPAEPPTAKVEELLAKQERTAENRLQTAMTAVHAQIASLEQTVQQVREKADSVAQSPMQPLSAAAAKASIGDESSLHNGFKDFLDQSFLRIESSISNLRDVPGLQPERSRAAELEWLRKAIPSGSTDMLLRVQQAMENLDRLGPKNAYPVT